MNPSLLRITKHEAPLRQPAGTPVAGREKRVIRVAHVSDLHLEPWRAPDELRPLHRAAADKLKQEKPDIILITGDSVDKPSGLRSLDIWLGLLESVKNRSGSRPPVFAITGNHEYAKGIGVDRVRKIFESHGVTFLKNEWAKTSIPVTPGDGPPEGKAPDRQDVALYGFDSLVFGKPEMPTAADVAALRPDVIHLVLIHEPALADKLPPSITRRASTFAFAGHTHGGQITLGRCRFYLPRGSGRFVDGSYRIGEMTFYVSRGIGSSTIDVRMEALPEILEVELETGEADAGAAMTRMAEMTAPAITSPSPPAP